MRKRLIRILIICIILTIIGVPLGYIGGKKFIHSYADKWADKLIKLDQSGLLSQSFGAAWQDVVYGDGWFNVIKKAFIKAVLGVVPEKGGLGVLNDLRPSNARKSSPGGSAVPRFRFVGKGVIAGGAGKKFVLGADDGAVPLHSSCMSAKQEAIESCSGSIAANGEIKTVIGPSKGTWHGYYPVLMAASANHMDTIASKQKGSIVTVNESDVIVKNNVKLTFKTSRTMIGGLNYPVRTIVGSNGLSMSQLVVNAISYL